MRRHGQIRAFCVLSLILILHEGKKKREKGDCDTNLLILLEGDPGIEPGTFGSGDQRSIH